MRCSKFSLGYVIALLWIGSAMMSSLAVAHTEGVEAADPETPAALLVLRSAAGGYDASTGSPTAWREIFTGDRAPRPMTMGEHGGASADGGASDHAGHMMHHDPASMQQ